MGIIRRSESAADKCCETLANSSSAGRFRNKIAFFKFGRDYRNRGISAESHGFLPNTLLRVCCETLNLAPGIVHLLTNYPRILGGNDSLLTKSRFSNLECFVTIGLTSLVTMTCNHRPELAENRPVNKPNFPARTDRHGEGLGGPSCGVFPLA
jgi:hypothetical protein